MDEYDDDIEPEASDISTFSTGLLDDAPPVSQEELIDRWENKNTTRYYRKILKDIEDAGFFYDTELALKTFAHTYFNSTTFMSNLTPQRASGWGEVGFDPQRYSRNLAELLMLENRASYTKMDIMKPQLLIIERSMANHLELIISRTVGKDREGILNREVRAKQEQISTTRDITKPRTNKRKLF